jgi:hypothetical protein
MLKQIFVLVALVAVASSTPVSSELVERGGGRILGGTDAPLGRFPWQGAIRCVAQGALFCGATIINNRWALTTAWCMRSFNGRGFHLVVGTVDWRTGAVHAAERVIEHPNFEENTYRSNIALINTRTPIVFNTNTRGIALGSTAIGGGVNAVMTGWGGRWGRSNLLQQITVQTLTNAQCRTRMGSWSTYIFDQSLCTAQTTVQ